MVTKPVKLAWGFFSYLSKETDRINGMIRSLQILYGTFLLSYFVLIPVFSYFCSFCFAQHVHSHEDTQNSIN